MIRVQPLKFERIDPIEEQKKARSDSIGTFIVYLSIVGLIRLGKYTSTSCNQFSYYIITILCIRLYFSCKHYFYLLLNYVVKKFEIVIFLSASKIVSYKQGI